MRETPLDIMPYFMAGLSKEERSTPDVPGLTRAIGIVPEIGGVELGEDFDPITVDIDNPFPDVFRGTYETVIAGRTSIYTLNEVSGVAQLLTSSAVEGGPWHFVDFDSVWFLFNGSCVVRKKADGTVEVSTQPTINSGCRVRGRAVFGGLTADFWLSGWKDAYKQWCELENTGLPTDMPMYPNSVYWSCSGGGDIEWLFDRSNAITGPLGADMGYDSTYPFYVDFLRRMDWGFHECEWQGTVLAVVALGSKFVAYGDNGVSLFTPVMDPLPGFGETVIMPKGILSRSAVCSALTFHIFIDSTFTLWRLRGDGALERLGFKPYLQRMSPDTLKIHFDRDRGRFYICDGLLCYILSSDVLTESRRMVYGISKVTTQPVAIYSGDHDEIDIMSDTVVFNRTGLTTIRGVNYKLHGLSQGRLLMEFIYPGEQLWRTLELPLSPEGAAFPQVTAEKFRFGLRGTPASDFSLSKAEIRVLSSDRRFTRGIGVTSTNSQ